MARTATETTAPRKRTKRAKTNGAHKNGNGIKAKATPVDAFGFRKGSLKSKAAAMYAAKGGATLSAVKAKLNSTQFNLLTELKARAKEFRVERSQVAGVGKRKATAYHISAR